MARTTRAKRRLKLFGAGVLATAVVGAGSYGGLRWYRAQQVLEAREVGYTRFAAGDFAGALEPLSAFVSKNNEDVDALLKLAVCRSNVPSTNRRHLIDAASFYRAVLRVEPTNRDALAGLVTLYLQLGFAAELRPVVNDLLSLEPNHIKALDARMQLARSVQEWGPAMADCDKLMALEPENYRWRAQALEIQRGANASLDERVATVRRWLQEAGEGSSQNGFLHLLLANLYRSEGKFAEAQVEARIAVQLGMPDVDTLGMLIEVLDLLQMPEEALAAIKAAGERGLDPAGMALMQVHRHWLAGRLDRSMSHLESAPPAEGTAQVELLRWRIMLAESTRDFAASDAAITELRTLAASHADMAQTALPWADAIVATRGADSGLPLSPKLAMAALDRGHAVDPTDAYLLLRAGDVSIRSGEPDEAARYFQQAFEMERRGWSLAGVRATTALLGVGRTEQAFRLALELVTRFPANPPVYFVLAQACDALAREGRTPASVDPSLSSTITASAILEGLYKQLDEAPIFLPPLISTKISEGLDDDARRLGRKAVDDPNTESDSLLVIAVLLSERRFDDIAERAIEAARSRNADPVQLTVARARLQIARGEAVAARAMVREALSSAAPSARALLARVQAEAAIAANATDAVGVLSECLLEGGNEIDTVSYVISQSATWTDRTLVAAAIVKLRELSGERSPRAVLTDAARVLRFERHSGEEVAKATIAVNELLKVNENSTAALVTLARLLASAQPPDMTNAAIYMKRAVGLQPGRRDLYPELIAMLQTSGDFAEATSYLQRFMRSAEGDADQGRLAASLMVAGGQYLSAIPMLERVSQQTGTEADLVALADAKRRAGRLDEAEQAFKDALDLPDRSVLSAMAYAEFLARSGRLDDARRMAEEDALRPKPALTPANRAYLLARLDLDYGDPRAAGAAVAEATRLAPDSPGVALLAARHKLAEGDLQGAIKLAQTGLVKSPKDGQLLTFVASLLMSDPSTRAGSEQMLEVLRAENPALAELLAIVRVSAGADGSLSPGAAQLQAVNELTERYPVSAPVWTVACEMHEAAGKIDEAVRIARRGMARLPSDPGPAAIASRLLLRQHRLEEAREAARTWRSLTADSPLDAELILARIALIAGKPREAITTLSPYIVRLQGEAAKRPHGLGTYTAALLLEGNVEAAFDAAKQQLHIPGVRMEFLAGVRIAESPTALDALARLGTAIATDDNGRLALVSEYAALAHRKDAADEAQRRAAALLGALTEARAAPVTMLLVADLAAARGDTANASAGYDAVWNSIPAATRDTLLQWNSLDAKAKRELGGPLSVALYASNNQASMLAEAGVDLDTALTAVDRALVMQPADPSLLDTKAMVLLAQKELDQARSLLTPLLLKPDVTPGVLMTLARIEVAADRIEEARRHVDAAARIVADDPLTDRVVIARLEALRRQVTDAARKPRT
mgnify:CR=1 FL=1